LSGLDPLPPVYFEQLRPPPALSTTIECFWRLLLPRVVAPDELISAEGRAEILFQFEGQSQILPPDSEIPFNCASSWLMRPFAHALHVRQVGITSSAMIGVRFSSGGWAAFRHCDTTNKQAYSFMPLNYFYPAIEVRLLEEQLYHALYTPNWAHPLVSFFLSRQLDPLHFDRISYAAQRLRQQPMSPSILAEDVNLSERQFGRVFRQIIGLAPKQFSRIARLERVLKSPVYKNYGMTLEQLALRYGYHDAPHLVREFRDLVGLSPLDYFFGNHDLIEQKLQEHDQFIQWEPDMMSMLTTK
jgi:AraC-like DNA-binding protein